MKLNVIENELCRFNDNDEFLVGELTHLLSMLPIDMPVKFSVLLEKDLYFTQDENFIFTISCDTPEDRAKGKFFLRIVTNSKPHLSKKEIC
jgi:hypothetical protein